MILLAIEHCNGEIMEIPEIIELKDLNHYKSGSYLIFLINVYDNTVMEIC